MTAPAGVAHSTGLKFRVVSRSKKITSDLAPDEYGVEVAITDVLFRKQDLLAWSPAKKLQYAVLTDALACLNLKDGSSYHDTIQWIKSNERDYVFSFNYCCMSFDLDPEATRRAVLSAKKNMD